MKFKGIVIGLLAAIFATCLYTSYKLIIESKQQTEILLILGKAEMDRSYFEVGSILQEDYQQNVWDRGDKLAKIIYGTN